MALSLADPTTPPESPAPAEPAKGSPGKPLPRAIPKLILEKNPSEENRALYGEMIHLFTLARSHRRPMVQQWERNYKALYNDYWGQTRATWLPSPSLPEIYPIVDALVAWESDQRPRYTIAPQALPHSDFARFFEDLADNLEVVLDASYQVNDEEGQIAIAEWDKYVYGTGILKTTWDMTLAGGLGDAITRRISPFAFYPDPQATCMEDANYFIELRRMSIQELDRRYPGTDALFREGGTDLDSDREPTQITGSGEGEPRRVSPGNISPNTSASYGPPGKAGVRATDIPGITVLECWIRQHKTYSATEINTRESIKRVKDEWRLVVCAGSQVILDTPASDLWSHGGHPYDRIVLRDTGEFWGRALVKILTSAQSNLNRILAAMQHNVELTGNPIYKDVGQQGRTPLTNRPGQRIPASLAGKDSDWLKPPQMPQSMPELMKYYLQRMEAISGLTAVARGGAPAGRNAQGVVDAIQEAGFVRIRSSLRILESAMRSAAWKKAALIAENYTTPRIVATAGPGGERLSMMLKARHFQIPTSDGATPLKYQLMVDIGSRQHTSRIMREDNAVRLFTLGAIDREALLEDTDYPNAQAVAERMDKKEMELAQAGQQAGPGQRQRARA
jgi:hypothetical protein